MIDRLMTALGIQNNAEDAAAQEDKVNNRRHPRRNCDQCIAEIDGLNYPIEDWSPGGVRVFCDSRTFGVGQNVPITLKFRLQNDVVRVAHEGTVVRKGNDTVGLQFAPLPQNVRQVFQHVIDDINTSEFANSQSR